MLHVFVVHIHVSFESVVLVLGHVVVWKEFYDVGTDAFDSAFSTRTLDGELSCVYLDLKTLAQAVPVEAVPALQQPQIRKVDFLQADRTSHVQRLFRLLRDLPLQRILFFFVKSPSRILITLFKLSLLLTLLFQHLTNKLFTLVFLHFGWYYGPIESIGAG